MSTGRVILDDVEKMVAPGDIVENFVVCKHSVIADEPLKIIKVKRGEYITVADKVIHELERK